MEPLVPTHKPLEEGPVHSNVEAETTFQNLKQAMSNASVVALPNIVKPFILETDANSYNIRAILM